MLLAQTVTRKSFYYDALFWISLQKFNMVKLGNNCHNPNSTTTQLNSTKVGFDMKMTLHTPPPPGTLLAVLEQFRAILTNTL